MQDVTELFRVQLDGGQIEGPRHQDVFYMVETRLEPAEDYPFAQVHVEVNRVTYHPGLPIELPDDLVYRETTKDGKFPRFVKV